MIVCYNLTKKYAYFNNMPSRNMIKIALPHMGSILICCALAKEVTCAPGL